MGGKEERYEATAILSEPGLRVASGGSADNRLVYLQRKVFQQTQGGDTTIQVPGLREKVFHAKLSY
jgi:hypothetical protein